MKVNCYISLPKEYKLFTVYMKTETRYLQNQHYNCRNINALVTNFITVNSNSRFSNSSAQQLKGKHYGNDQLAAGSA